MLDIGWSEILVIAIVMIVVVGPKDLPKMLRAFGKATSRMRSTANEFKKQFDEALREAELDDVKTVIEETRKLDPRKNMTKVFEPIRAAGEDLRSSLTQSPKPAADTVKTEASESDKPADSGKTVTTEAVTSQPVEAEKPAFTISDPEPEKRVNSASSRKKAEPSEADVAIKSSKAAAPKKAASTEKQAKATAKPAAKKATPAKKPAAKASSSVAAQSKSKTVKETETKA